eukprot:CAMPEP_0115459460 /NCGR_PEP_ID=MMETSP0271-20121206/46264_1 /TAXON_ID=71861 /ORGANISM="Scrippsiella trochoidea, Strain CCMP3099" /LENGTH=64 /DNA_ID=CAMNT_0002886105 /DNA_START=67 /DNA_END=262 /DNA_ORIENTATION=-
MHKDVSCYGSWPEARLAEGPEVWQKKAKGREQHAHDSNLLPGPRSCDGRRPEQNSAKHSLITEL